jgi:hypothetical protein
MGQLLLGAAIALFSGLLSGWLGIKWQEDRNAKALAFALLAEIEVAVAMDEQGNAQRFHRQVLKALREDGAIWNREAFRQIVDFDAVESLPVYHASVGSLGMLPYPIAQAVIEHYASTVGLLRMAARFIGQDVGLTADEMKAMGGALELLYDATLDRRDKVIAQLRSYLRLPAGEAIPRMEATPPREELPAQ